MFRYTAFCNGPDGVELKDWAGKTLPALQRHLEMAQELDKNRK